MVVTVIFTVSSFAQELSPGKNHATESYGQVNFPLIEGVTITHSLDPVSVFLTGSLACRLTSNNVTVENHYYRSFMLSDFGITDDYNVTMVDIGIQEALGPNGGVQPLTCNLYITDGTPFPNGYPNSLTLIGTTTLDVPDQAGTHFSIDVTGTAPAGSELVVEISIPNGILAGNIFFMGINNFGETAPSYVMAPTCGFPVPTPAPSGAGFTNQHYVMSVTGDTTGISVGIGDEFNRPHTFYLDQNYPNPFNPTTTIKYSIPTAASTSIKVFDIQGKEVAVLVNEFKSQGSYAVKFDGTDLSNGIYFYQLQAGSFTETKKMVLAK